MIDHEFIESLSCPYCRSALTPRSTLAGTERTTEHGTVACSCYEYPIVDGILVVRQLSGPSDARDEAVLRLHRGDVDGARSFLVTHASMVSDPADSSESFGSKLRDVLSTAQTFVDDHLRGRARSNPTPLTPPVLAALNEARPAAYASYLFQRYANPSFAASIPMMALLEQIERAPKFGSNATVLDLACGVGHSTAMMKALFPSLDFVASDPDFVNLQLLRRHFVDDAVCVCLDAELPLPFADAQFDASFCLDAFHYIRAKWALARELDRVIASRGIMIFPHLHNAACENPSPGIPLEPTDYLRMVNFADAMLVDESVVLQQFMTEQVLDLTTPPALVDLADTPNLSMLVTRGHDIRKRFDIGRRLLNSTDSSTLGINPIYAVDAADDTLRLRREWPTPHLERECALMNRYLPELVELNGAMINRLNRCRAFSEADARAVAGLVHSLVLIPLPPSYRPPEVPSTA